MKDLKHLIYFENLLQEANNELVQKAKANGEYAIGYTCYFMPEVLLDLARLLLRQTESAAMHFP